MLKLRCKRSAIVPVLKGRFFATGIAVVVCVGISAASTISAQAAGRVRSKNFAPNELSSLRFASDEDRICRRHWNSSNACTAANDCDSVINATEPDSLLMMATGVFIVAGTLRRRVANGIAPLP